jgi:hypothetical protein
MRYRRPVVEVTAGRSWADLVFHVLAHVRATASLSASLYDAEYGEWCAGILGDPEGRELAADARVLAELAPSHDELAFLQLLAWLFDDEARARAVETIDLTDLDGAAVDDRALLAVLKKSGTRALRALEVLRCAAALERHAFARLPEVARDDDALRTALAGVVPAAPALVRHRIVTVRALRLRGRVRGEEIWIGAPGACRGPSLDHVAWQAAHEATVAELHDAWVRKGHDALETAALRLLATRARDAGLEDPHARWLAHLHPSCIARARD